MRYSNPFRAAVLLAASAIWSAPAQDPTVPQLTVRGGTPAAVTLSAGDLASMPRETVSLAEQNGAKASYEGVPLREILQRAGAPLGKELRGKALAGYVLAKAADGYEVVFSLGELDQAFGNLSILVADKRDGKPLTGKQGPLRLVCPNDKAGARSVRMLESVELVRLRN
jgi:DMSO/TMAO reductase YedYZ molybdopterin-dependent catalytic subunit